jgi:secreted PhoX family phosphatase
MRKKTLPLTILLTQAIALAFFAGASNANDGGHHSHGHGHKDIDFGVKAENFLKENSKKYFGIKKPLDESAPATEGAYRTESQSASDQVMLAKGLQAEYVTRNAGDKTDMMVLWPQDNPTHIVTCVEGNREDIGMGKFNPAVQRIDLQTGAVETILRGMDRCDGIRTTVWGTVLATEEADDGMAYEIAQPLVTTENTVDDRTTGAISGTTSANIIQRTALPTMAWEGLTVLESGVVIAGDELRPGTAEPDIDGGAIFKFIPDTPWNGQSGIENSPLASGSVYAMQVTCVEKKQQFGQGCEIGQATWVGPLTASEARTEAANAGATGYYRPEDLHLDPMFVAPEEFASAVRFCWANTGREKAENYGEVICGIDHEPLTATVVDDEDRLVTVNRFIEGDTDFNSFDNLAFQPKTGNLYVIEDHANGDVFACLPDGADRDIKSDGCIKILSVKDSSAEPTGFFFTDDGKTAYVSIQHSNDDNMPLFDDYPTDDVLKITGFKVKY